MQKHEDSANALHPVEPTVTAPVPPSETESTATTEGDAPTMIDRSTHYIPRNFTTHRQSWRKALTLAIANTSGDESAYWEHELAAYDRSFDRLLAVPLPKSGSTLAEVSTVERKLPDLDLDLDALVDMGEQGRNGQFAHDVRSLRKLHRSAATTATSEPHSSSTDAGVLPKFNRADAGVSAGADAPVDASHEVKPIEAFGYFREILDPAGSPTGTWIGWPTLELAQRPQSDVAGSVVMPLYVSLAEAERATAAASSKIGTVIANGRPWVGFTTEQWIHISKMHEGYPNMSTKDMVTLAMQLTQTALQKNNVEPVA